MDQLTRVKFLVAEERRITAELILELLNVEKSLLYAELGYPNMFEFLKKECGYSESAAFRRLAAMRLQKENGAVAEKLKSGELSLTNASRLVTLQNAAKRQNISLPKEDLFQAALNSSSREAEKKFVEIASSCGMEMKRDPLREKIEQVKGLLSHQHPGLSDEELFSLLLDKEIARATAQGNNGRGKSETLTRYIPAKVKREVRARDRSCTFLDGKTGRRCGAVHFLQFHHIIPFALGGKTNAENLTMHCRAHNHLEAKRAGLAIR